jgi:HptB-dependent secretion and biofilm anti anti-sigma factor
MTGSEAMNISTHQSGGETIVALVGRFTFSAHATFRDVLVNHVEAMNSGGRVTFDLAGVEFVDSAALGMLLLAREAARRRSGTIAIRGASGQVRRMLDVSRFEALFTIEA